MNWDNDCFKLIAIVFSWSVQDLNRNLRKKNLSSHRRSSVAINALSIVKKSIAFLWNWILTKIKLEFDLQFFNDWLYFLTNTL